MSGEDSGNSNVKDVAEAVATVAKAIPIYQDAIQPAAKEAGKGLKTVAQTVNVALAPLKGLVWGYDQIESFISSRVSEKLSGIPEENIITPKASVAGPAIEALRFAADEEELREMFANLLANAMDKNTADSTHPAFVDMIKNMSADEAKIMTLFNQPVKRFPLIHIESRELQNSAQIMVGTKPHFFNFSMLGEFAKCKSPERTPSYLENLQRLGLVNIRFDASLTSNGLYTPLTNHPFVQQWRAVIEKDGTQELVPTRGLIEGTPLGIQFWETCVRKKSP